MIKIDNFKLLIILLFAAALASCGSYTTVRHQHNYQQKLSDYPQVLIIPADAEVNIVSALGHKERVHDYEYHLEQLITDQIQQVFAAKGFRAKLLHKKNIHDLKLNQKFYNFRAKYNGAREELYKPLTMLVEKAHNIDVNIGKEAKIIGEATQCKFLIVTDYNRAVKTNGARTMDFAASLLFGHHEGAENADTAVMFIGIVDAATGNILWINFGSQVKDIYISAFENLSDRDKTDISSLKELIASILLPLK